MKKILCFLLALTLLCGALASCGPDESDLELLATAKELTEASARVNRLLFGEGILPKENGKKIGVYVEADEASLADWGVSSVADVEEIAESVYSLALCGWIKQTVLTSSKDDNSGTVLTYARYYVGDVEIDADTKERIFLVNTSHEPTVGETSYANYRIAKKDGNVVSFLVDITVTHEGKTVTYSDQRISMYKEAHGWRLDTPTYATFE